MKTPAFLTIMALACMVFIADGVRAQARDPGPGPLSLEALRAARTDAGSRFKTVDGVEIHYRDEGQGFPVMLLHASYLNLSSWDLTAEALKKDFRVIRFDFPSQGLSGDETRVPEGGRINLADRNAEMVLLMADALGLKTFDLVATSSGGNAAMRFAAAHPERVNRLVFINSGGLPRTPTSDPNRDKPGEAQWEGMKYKPRAFWAYSSGLNFPSLTSPPSWFLDLVTDINRREKLYNPKLYSFSTGDPEALLGRIKAPTLILWGKDNPTVVHLEADVMSHWMTAAPTLVKKYEGLGHYPYVEAPDSVATDLRRFLKGELDENLRRTDRVKVAINARSGP
jgi:pimeloyl-ACP methyl ester carboxylesterase